MHEDKFKALGYEVWQTGGGCTAYGKTISKEEDSYILVCSFWGMYHEEHNGEGYLVCVYDDSGDFTTINEDKLVGLCLNDTLRLLGILSARERTIEGYIERGKLFVEQEL